MRAKLPRIVTLALVTVFVSGCPDAAVKITPKQQALLTEGQDAYDKQQYRRAIDRLTQFLQEAPAGPTRGQGYYVRGLSNAKLGNRADAYSDLQDALRQSPDADTEWRTHVVLGSLRFEDSAWRPAADDFQKAVDKMPALPPMDVVLYRLGLCLERAGDWNAAQKVFQRLSTQFPQSSVRTASDRRLSLDTQVFAIQCGVYSLAKNADNQLVDLQRKGFEAWIRRDTRPHGPVFLVLVGHYNSYTAAQQQLEVVRRQVPDAVLWP